MSKALWIAAASCCAAAVFLASTAVAQAPATLSAEQAAALQASPADPPAKKLAGVSAEYEGRHYLAGDEWNMQLFYERVHGLGGGYMGVGSDQAYLLVGWARPEIAWLMDYDDLVPRLHAAYRVLFLESDTPAAFIDRVQTANLRATLKLLDEKLPAEGKADVLRTFKMARPGVVVRFARLKRTLAKAKVPSYLTGQGEYDFVRGLYKAGRIRFMHGDLLGTRGIAGIAETAKKLGVPIRLIYTSNAEQYWGYSAQFRSNIEALPFDDKTLVARTLSTWKRNQDYCYHLQTGASFRAYLAAKAFKIYAIFRCPRNDDELTKRVFFTDAPPASRGKKGKK